jgi:spore coat polysaccharide biosynthesis protein SpsF
VTVLCVVQARMGSSRLPGKVLKDVGGRPMLLYMLERLAPLRVDELVVATTDLDRDSPVADAAAAAGRPVVRGSEQDVLARFGACLDRHPADTVVRLTADCPLADPALVEAVVDLHMARGADYTCNVLPRTFPKGLDVEVMSAGSLRTAAAEARDQPEREHVTPFLYRHPERFRLANLRSGDDLGDERWTVDTADDLEFVRRVVEDFGGRTDFGWRDVLTAVGRKPVRSDGVYLRPAIASDADDVLRWRNEPDAVRRSGTGRPADPAEHRDWFAGRLDDPATRLWIAELDSTSVGFVRVDVASAVGTVSIAIDADRRGHGLGTAILHAVLERLEGDFQIEVLEALVQPDNVASLRAFQAAGFRPAGQRGPLTLLRWARMEDTRRESTS